MLNRMLDLLSESTLISGLLAIGIIGTCGYLAITGQPIPESIAGMGFSIIAFFFGSRAGKQTERIRAQLKAQQEKEKLYNEWLQSVG